MSYDKTNWRSISLANEATQVRRMREDLEEFRSEFIRLRGVDQRVSHNNTWFLSVGPLGHVSRRDWTRYNYY